MFKKEARMGLIVHLYYNRDSKKLENVGDVIYHSKKHRYLQIYIPKENAEAIKEKLMKERYVKKVRICHIQELDNDFVGSLQKN